MFENTKTPPSLPSQVHPQESNPRFPASPAKRLLSGDPLPVEQSPNQGPDLPSISPNPEDTAPEWGKPRRDFPDVTFRHSGWKPHRDRVFAALILAGAPQARLDRFDQCGCNAWLLRSLDQPGRYKLSSNKCHDRFCRPCGNERSRLIAANVRKNLAGKLQRFLTLTLKADKTTLVAAIAKITLCFARLRNRKEWTRRVTGGVAFLEIKRSKLNNRWHVHLHVIIEGSYLPKEWLSKTWLKITGDSFIVDIRLVKNPDVTIRYVTKYAAKPIDAATIRDDDRLLEAIQALSGRRLAITFGDWRGTSLTDPIDDGDWETICPLNDLLRRASQQDHQAMTLLAILREKKPCKTRAPPPSTRHASATAGQAN